MIASILFALVLASGPSGTLGTKLDADRVNALTALPAADEDIRRSLFEMLQRDPERVVCTSRVHTGSRQPRTTCGTLRKWFDARLPQEISNKEAPWLLVEEIKEQRKKALLRVR